MDHQAQPKAWRILIVSSHPLFGKGLHKMLGARPNSKVQVMGIVPDIDQALQLLESSQPDLVILDYDDEHVNRQIFLQHFVGGERRLRVVLLSLKEGGSQAVVYDRRTLAASQIDAWL
jgi:DNA-binding NarL/FixJ family response regulator